MLLHFLPLPLIVEFDIDTYALPLYQEKIHPALQHHHRVVSLFIRQWSWVDPMKHMALDNAFPILETLSLSSADYTTKALPNNFVAPRLRSLSLSKVAISAASSLLANLAEIVSLDIEYIPNYDDILPEYLVEVLSGFPHLENLCISPRLPSTMVRELRRTTRITRVVLPSLLTFKYEGVSGYLENLLALISTPLLRCFRVMFGPKLTSALPCLSDFLGTIQNPDVGIAEISFLPSVVFVTYHPAQPSSSLSSFSFSIHGDCDKANMVEICGATAPAFPAVQRLLLFARREGDSQMSKEYWHAFLRLFGGVTTLQTDIYLTAQLSDIRKTGKYFFVLFCTYLPLL
jgi:hypothetical protein